MTLAHGPSVEGLHLEHEIGIVGIVPPFAEEVGEVLVENHLHIKVLEHPTVQGERKGGSSGREDHTHSLLKERKVDEVLWQIHDSVELKVVLGPKQRQSFSRVQRGVKGHGEHFIADEPAAVLSPLVCLPQPPSVDQRE